MPAARPPSQRDACPCGSSRPLTDCCGRYLAGDALAPTPEALMRSRYSAYVLGQADYLAATWHPTTRPGAITPGDPAPRWLGLEVRRVTTGGADDGTVEFVARYRVGGRGHRLHEISRFVREDGRWYYVDGVLAE
ncbi:MAG: SEC-C domain-containing protein [Burkholderiales bacterium]|nr:SEC-C domain-containing protein [Burkholderiales bacterium]